MVCKLRERLLLRMAYRSLSLETRIVLKQAQQWLADENLRSDYIEADLVSEQQAAEAVAEVVRRHGSLDLLMNSVGQSTRCDFSNASPNQFRQQLDFNLMTAIHTSVPALPHLSESSGHVVNIGSLSSKFPWPWMAPYTTSKFALAGFTHQLRIESPKNVHVMLVCPGPIRRNDAGNRYRDQTNELPEEANAPAAGAKLKGICPEKLSRKILAGCRRRSAELVIPQKARLLSLVYSISAGWGDWVSRRFRSNSEH